MDGVKNNTATAADSTVTKFKPDAGQESACINTKVYDEINSDGDVRKTRLAALRMEILANSTESLEAVNSTTEKNYQGARSNYVAQLRGLNTSPYPGGAFPQGNTDAQLDALSHQLSLKFTYNNQKQITNATWQEWGTLYNGAYYPSATTNWDAFVGPVTDKTLSINIDELNRMPGHIKQNIGLLQGDLNDLFRGGYLLENEKADKRLVESDIGRLKTGCDTLFKDAREFEVEAFSDTLRETRLHAERLSDRQGFTKLRADLKALENYFNVLVAGDGEFKPRNYYGSKPTFEDFKKWESLIQSPFTQNL